MKIKIRAELLPIPIIVLGVFLILYSVIGLIINQAYLINIIVMVAGLILITTHQGVTISPKDKEISDYYWVLGLKINTYKQPYHRFETIVLSQTNYTQGYGFVPRMNTSGLLYQGFLKIEGKDAVYLGQSKNKEILRQKLDRIAEQLGVSITDTSGEQYTF